MVENKYHKGAYMSYRSDDLKAQVAEVKSLLGKSIQKEAMVISASWFNSWAEASGFYDYDKIEFFQTNADENQSIMIEPIDNTLLL